MFYLKDTFSQLGFGSTVGAQQRGPEFKSHPGRGHSVWSRVRLWVKGLLTPSVLGHRGAESNKLLRVQTDVSGASHVSLPANSGCILCIQTKLMDCHMEHTEM